MKRTIKKLNAMPYAQAHIEIIDDTAYLFSYTTLVASVRVDNEGKWIRCYGLYSMTTRKHISAFAKEYGLTFHDFKAYAGRNLISTPIQARSYSMKGATPSKNKLTHLVVNFYVFHWQDTPTCGRGCFVLRLAGGCCEPIFVNF